MFNIVNNNTSLYLIKNYHRLRLDADNSFNLVNKKINLKKNKFKRKFIVIFFD